MRFGKKKAFDWNVKSASNKLQKNNRFLDLYIVGHRFEIFVWEISSVSDFMCSSNTLQIIIRRPYKISLSPEIVDKFHETFCQSLLNIIQILSDIFKNWQFGLSSRWQFLQCKNIKESCFNWATVGFSPCFSFILYQLLIFWISSPRWETDSDLSPIRDDSLTEIEN